MTEQLHSANSLHINSVEDLHRRTVRWLIESGRYPSHEALGHSVLAFLAGSDDELAEHLRWAPMHADGKPKSTKIPQGVSRV